MKILVTGASRGLGLEITRRELAAGNSIIALSRTLGTGLAEAMQAYPDSLQHLACDLALPMDQVETIISDSLPPEVVIDGLVNNAAIAYDDLTTNLKVERLGEMLQVNTVAPMWLTRFVIRRMLLHSTSGTLVHISSVCAHTGYKGLAMYAASKGAIEAFSRNVAREWGAKGIRSNCVVPGFMETDMSASLDDEQKRRIYQRTSLKAATCPHSVAAVVSMLLSNESESVTGQNFHVDAGT